jgi:hypothetical protein
MSTKIIFIQQETKISFPNAVPGPPGPPGPPGGQVVTYPAGETLSAGRVVIIDDGEAFYFQPSISAHAGRAFGVTTTSATAGNTVSVQLTGEATDAGFASLPDTPLWVGDDGEIQTAWPATGSIQKAGVKSGTNKIKLDFSVQIIQTS